MSSRILISLPLLALAVASTTDLAAAVKPAPAIGRTLIPHPRTRPEGPLSLDFEPNLGQSDPRVRYVGRGRGSIVFVTDEGAVLETGRLPGGNEVRDNLGSFDPARFRFKLQTIRMTMVDGLKPPAMTASEPRRCVSSYFKGRDPAKWISKAPHYGRVLAKSVYPGVDIAYYGQEGQLEYDFVVAPGADANQIHLAFSGQDSMRVTPSGDLILATANGDFIQRRPKVYQNLNGRQVEVAAAYRIDGAKVGFQLARYDASEPLVIDPVLVASTYLGGSSYDAIMGISGTPYSGYLSPDVAVAGYTMSADFPHASGDTNTTYNGNGDAFIARLDPNSGSFGEIVIFGGSQLDVATSVSVDPTNNKTCAGGFTFSPDFPLSASPYQSQGSTGAYSVGFLTCFPDQMYSPPTLSTYVGLYQAVVNSVAFSNDTVDSAERTLYIGGAAVRGELSNNTINCLNNPDSAYCLGTHTDRDGFFGIVLTYLLNADQIQLFQVGGSGDDVINSVSGGGFVGGGTYEGGIVAVGSTQSGDLQTVNPLKGGLTSNQNVMIVVWNLFDTAASLVTYFGGPNGADAGLTVKAFAPPDASAATFVLGGTTTATRWPTYGSALANTNAGGQDGFISQISTSLHVGVPSTILYSTLLGGSGDDYVNGITQTDVNGPIYAVGTTSSSNLPVVAPLAGNSSLRGASDAFVLQLTPDSQPAFLTYLGGDGPENGNGIAVFDNSGNIYVAGLTGSLNFPTGVNGVIDNSGAFQNGSQGGGGDGFVSRIFLSSASDILIESADAFNGSVFGGEPIDVFIDSNCTATSTQPYTTTWAATCGLAPSPGQISVAVPSHYVDSADGFEADFVDWDDGNTQTDRAFTAPFASSATHIARYNLRFKLNSSTGGTGSGTVMPPSGTYESNSSPVTITATPAPGSIFTGWSVSGSAALQDAASANTTITMYGAVTITANFALAPKTNPVITWANPAAITYGTPLGATQLDATANVPGAFVYTPPAGTVLPAGSAQTLSVKFTPTDAAEYNSVSKSVAINVNKATPAINWANPADITAGTPLGATQLDATANVPGAFVYTPPAGTVLSAGAGQTLSVKFTPTDATKYNMASKNVAINVDRTNPVITWANPADIVFGSALSAVQLSAAAGVPGTFAYKPPLGTVLLPGAGQTLQATFTPAGAGTYNAVSATVKVNVLHAPIPGVVVTSLLSRDPKTNEIVIALTLANTGDTALTNVAITSATLADPLSKTGPTQTSTALPIQVGAMPGDSIATVTLRYPAAAGTPGEAELLKIQGAYTGGSFASSAKAIVP